MSENFREPRPIEPQVDPSMHAPTEQQDSNDPPRGIRTMAVFRWILIGAMGVIAVLSVAYSAGLISTGSASAASAQYYCPMHPQVVQDHPGECPICSMSLVPKESGQSTGASKTAADKQAVSHEGHRHNPSDPYRCPMHPEETGLDATARCPICEMKLEKRPGAGGTPRTAASADPPSAKGEHAGHRHNPADPYFCPMHPEETGLDTKARCPICEMKLEKRAQQKPQGAQTQPMQTPAAPAAGNPQPQGGTQGVPGLVPVELSMDRVQLIGVRTAPATNEPLVPQLRTVGFVTADEAKLARVHTRFSGWIEHLAVATTGQKVRRGQLLAGIYNLELLPAQQEFLAARRWNAGAPASQPTATSPALRNSLEQDARARLELLGMSRAEIERIADTGKPTRTVAVSAPIAGYVTRKNAVQGTYVQPGTELFEIADLSRLWVLADIYEYEVGRVSEGQKAQVEVSSHPGQRLQAKIAFLYPTVDTESRTMRVRLELDNKGLKLRPGMYADVLIDLEQGSGVVVPKEALVDTGEYQYVFLARAGGRFEPRRVRAGARSGDKVQILEGISVGDTVVTTANFLIDSESRLRAAIAGTSESGAAVPAQASACDKDFDKAKFPDRYQECRQCERLHRGMGTMEEDCKNAIARPWR